MNAQIAHFEAFLAAAETLNFASAARSLFIAPSRLSQRIQELEAELGAALFTRTTRRTSLTAAGQSLIPRARSLMRELETIKTMFRTDNEAALRVGVRSLPTEFRDLLLNEVICPATESMPLTLQPLDSDRQLELILTGGLDVALLWYPTSEPELQQLPILSERIMIALPERDRYVDLDRVHPSDLVGLRLASIVDPSRFPARIAPYLEMLPLVDTVNAAVEGGLFMLLAGGSHCAFVPAAARDHALLSGVDGRGFVIKPLEDPEPNVVTYLTWRTDNQDPTVASIVRSARKRFSEPIRR